MSEHQQFMRALRANPEDLGLALVYADWLEEHATASPLVMGAMAERAQYLRLVCQTDPAPAGSTEPYPNQYESLWFYFSHLWIPEEIRLVFGNCNQILNPNESCYVHWRNGFIRTVHCRLSQVFRYGPQLVRWHPVTRWEISDAPAILTAVGQRRLVSYDFSPDFFRTAERSLRLFRASPYGEPMPASLWPPRMTGGVQVDYLRSFDNLLDRVGCGWDCSSAEADDLFSAELVRWCNQQADNFEDWCDAEIP